ncbi:MAG: hypothetical protein IAG13_33015 [Deltaproteobacteria bacterium]|nr:hypothetical protein [Nannocystaceae bacterium]
MGFFDRLFRRPGADATTNRAAASDDEPGKVPGWELIARIAADPSAWLT